MRSIIKKVSLAITLFVLIVTSLNLIELPVELRFEDVKYNYQFVITLCFLLPLSVFLTSLTLEKRSNTYLGVGLSIALALPCALVYFFVNSDIKSINEAGRDQSFEKIDEVSVGDSFYRLYRANGGATTSFGLVLRKETTLIEDLNIVKVVFEKYKASEGILTVIGNKSIELQIKPYNRGEKVEVIILNI